MWSPLSVDRDNKQYDHPLSLASQLVSTRLQKHQGFCWTAIASIRRFLCTEGVLHIRHRAILISRNG
jgi:hypothetical protein